MSSSSVQFSFFAVPPRSCELRNRTECGSPHDFNTSHRTSFCYTHTINVPYRILRTIIRPQSASEATRQRHTRRDHHCDLELQQAGLTAPELIASLLVLPCTSFSARTQKLTSVVRTGLSAHGLRLHSSMLLALDLPTPDRRRCSSIISSVCAECCSADIRRGRFRVGSGFAGAVGSAGAASGAGNASGLAGVQLRRCSGFARAARGVTPLVSCAIVRLPVEGSRARSNSRNRTAATAVPRSV